ncbi:MAG: hypothetical protein HN778_04845 [Prolixibacteraceae bacterium]|jgi:1-acyl-sn-glycerol-3-phosphate acyltransferase|nr:hypothetical protein [Prolixibacteraceae bacterium]MBT6005663.1 hypothetical protein [Prolixibacteraceae bacterium]MBT6763923.1 hypothetical protein [Prolixibacteraceae bacterium]MBT6999945.1 hypothetical protein [Prolixibacteraceae bacterium]MBT7394144.1 hypothetical protein [Prolixibacteraceae bacterium]
MKYEKWSFGYWCLKRYVIIVDWFIYKKIIITGKENIPKNKPIVFAPNHQNALSDPLAVLLNTPYQPVWLARADIFKSKTVSVILRFLKIMPVYRLRDGKENLAQNDKTFADSIKVLQNNFALALFPEAAHSAKRQMIPHKKAVPRIAFMAAEKTDYNLDIQIIPTGIYYSNYWKFDRSLIVNFGDPVPVHNYFDEYKENPNAATLSLRTKIYDSVLPLVLDFRSKKYYSDFEKIREVYGKHFLKRQNKKFSILNLFKSDQILAKHLDNLEIEKPIETEKLVLGINAFKSKIDKLKIRSWLIENPKNNFWMIGINKLVLFIGLPLFLFGFLFNAIPFFLIDQFVRKKVRDTSFWSSFFLGAGLILFPLIYVLELISFSWLLPGFWLKLAFLISLPFAGKLAFKWFILLRKTIGRGRLFCLKLFKNDEYKNLLLEKETLFRDLDNLISVNLL